MPAQPADAPNADQIAFWTDGPGRHWVALAEPLDRMHREALMALMASADPQPGETVLDIGCGAGASTLEIASRIAPGQVTGIDVAGPLLDLARQRATAAGAANARFTRADAQTHAFAPGAADLITSRFGVMFFEDPVAAFRNMAAALKPGGRIVFAAWTGGDENVWFTTPVKIGSLRLGVIPPEPTDAPGPMAFRDPERVTAILAAAGFTDAEARHTPFHLKLDGGLDAVMKIARHIGPLPRYLRDHQPPPEVQDAIFADLRAAFLPYEHDGGVDIPAATWIYSAVKP